MVDLNKEEPFVMTRTKIIGIKTKAGDRYTHFDYKISTANRCDLPEFAELGDSYFSLVEKEYRGSYPAVIWVRVKDAVEVKTMEVPYEYQ